MFDFSCRIFIRASLWHTFGRKKVLHFGLFSKSCSQKVQSIGCLDFHFWAQKWNFSARNFLVFLLPNLYQSIHCAHFCRKKCIIWPFFEKLSPKSTVYRLSRFHFFANFFFLSFKMYFLVRNLFRISSFLSNKSWSEHLLSHTFGQKKTFCNLAFFWKSVASAKSTVYRLSRLLKKFLSPKMYFSARKFFVQFFLSNLYQSIIVHTFSQKKVLHLAVFSKSCSEKYSL